MNCLTQTFLDSNSPDPIFRNFIRTKATLLSNTDDGGGDINFLGVHVPLYVDELRYPGEYWSGRTSDQWPGDSSLPTPFHEDYFEYIDLLFSICKSDKHYQMAEVGAGYGRWVLNASQAIKRLIPKKITSSFFLGFEADPERINFFHEMMKINKIEKKNYKLFEKIVTSKKGKYQKEKLPFVINKNSASKFGGMIVDDERDNLSGRQSISNENWVKIKKLPTVSLMEACSEYGIFDFMNFDIQNAEIDVIPGSIDTLNKHVKLVHVATHSILADKIVQSTFLDAGWHPRWSFNWKSKVKTTFGKDIQFRDGVFSFTNPHILSNTKL
jgi:hypothetical protein